MNQPKFIYIPTLLSLFCFTAFSANITNTSQSKDTQNLDPIQQIEPNDTKTNFFEQNKDLILKFIKKPKFSRSSIKCFFRHTFNNPYYADKYLPFDMSHIIAFSRFAAQTEKPREYLYNVISIFKSKLFFSRCINGYEFENFLSQYLSLVAPYFDQKHEDVQRIAKIKERLYQLLYDDFEKLKANPEQILDETALSLDLITNNRGQNAEVELDLSIYDLQHAVFNLIQHCLPKLIWNPKANDSQFWESIKSISSMLEEGLKKQILPTSNHLNELFWAQLSSFSYLIESWGSILPENFYNNLLEEINTKPFKLWTLKENDPLLLSKFRHLNYVLNQGHMRSKLHQNGNNSIMPFQLH